MVHSKAHNLCYPIHSIQMIITNTHIYTYYTQYTYYYICSESDENRFVKQSNETDNVILRLMQIYLLWWKIDAMNSKIWFNFRLVPLYSLALYELTTHKINQSNWLCMFFFYFSLCVEGLNCILVRDYNRCALKMVTIFNWNKVSE